MPQVSSRWTAIATAVPLMAALGGGLWWWESHSQPLNAGTQAAIAPRTAPANVASVPAGSLPAGSLPAAAPIAPAEPAAPAVVAAAPAAVQPAPQPAPESEAKGETAHIYQVTARNNAIAFEPSAVAVQPATTPEAQLRATLQALLNNPKNSAIPQGTQLKKVTIKGKEVYVDLSDDFLKGGGTASMTARVAQVLYTVNEQQKDARIWLLVDGKVVESLGGEGILLEQPLSKQKFESEFGL